MLKNDMLPPLQNLLAFELSAKHLSFTTAARELGTTQPAISQQIRSLESFLGVALFTRVYRGVELTPSGQALFLSVQTSFKALRQTCTEICYRPTSQRIHVATDFAFAAFGLMPKIAEFRKIHQSSYPDLDIQFQTSQSQVELAGSNVDVAIVFGDGDFQGYESFLLIPEEVYPVCSPKLLEADNDTIEFDTLLQLPLLKLNETENKRWLNMDDFILHHSGTFTEKAFSMELDNFTLLIQAAIAGQGVCLAWSPLVNDFIRDGLLVAFPQFKVTSNRGYYLVLPEQSERTELVKKFVDWLKVSMVTPLSKGGIL